MGQASLSIYVNELIDFYHVKKIIRVGTCGSYQEKVKIRDIVLAQSSSTDSAHNKIVFQGMNFSACSDFNLLMKAYNLATATGKTPHVGNILAFDSFYTYYKDDNWKKMGKLWSYRSRNANQCSLYNMCKK